MRGCQGFKFNPGGHSVGPVIISVYHCVVFTLPHPVRPTDREEGEILLIIKTEFHSGQVRIYFCTFNTSFGLWQQP